MAFFDSYKQRQEAQALNPEYSKKTVQCTVCDESIEVYVYKINSHFIPDLEQYCPNGHLLDKSDIES